MLPAAHRMRRSEDFRKAVRRGTRAGRPRLVVHLLAPPLPAPRRDEAPGTPGPTTVGLVVSRGVGGSVVRSTVKRRLRHLMAARLHRLPAGSRVVVRATPAAAGCSSAVLATDLDGALTAAGRRAGVRAGS